MKIVVVGLGYIGLPTAIVLAKAQHQVVGVDVNRRIVNRLNNLEIKKEEPFLKEGFEEVVDSGNFIAKMEAEVADAFIITVPTPNKDDTLKSCDLTHVIEAVRSILPYLQLGNIVIIESTVGPKTTECEILPLIESTGLKVGKDVYLLHCPERVLPGKIMHELVHNDRIIGGATPACAEAGMALYRTFVTGELIPTDASTAELSKLMENTFRDVNIGLANELVKIGNELGVDALEVIKLANHHPRVNIHQPGPGVGGHCLAVDPHFVIAAAPITAKLIREARTINQRMPAYIRSKVEEIMTNIDGKKIVVFGLTYKGNVDDTRESPAMDIYFELQRAGKYQVVAYDPHVDLHFVEREMQVAVENADLLLVLTDHSEFKYMDTSGMRNKVIFDTKGIVQRVSDEAQLLNLGNIFKIANEKVRN
ncbi:nucleotide sugar dehydrogenase [Listeria grandensis]|uniref:nucleotide sugar dehydrogenase n=1 Tax=Listeria grandensis TaxID=1494963 RepID=UPI00164D2A4A|nr:nucleotide sugar dehydrogenase [Listeria grandensis]MBC6316190.1 nucleotide sugar dehydrogenase [Listeria grandensis]